MGDNRSVNERRLTPDEDSELRLLHSLRSFGAVAESITSRYNALRGRDRRQSVRDPDDGAVAVPVEKTLWSDRKTSSQRSSGSGQRTDTREVIAEANEPRRGLFRR